MYLPFGCDIGDIQRQFHRAAEQLANVIEWNDDQSWGFTFSRAARSDRPLWPRERHRVAVLVPYLGDLAATGDGLQCIIADRAEGDGILTEETIRAPVVVPHGLVVGRGAVWEIADLREPRERTDAPPNDSIEAFRERLRLLVYLAHLVTWWPTRWVDTPFFRRASS